MLTIIFCYLCFVLCRECDRYSLSNSVFRARSMSQVQIEFRIAKTFDEEKAYV